MAYHSDIVIEMSSKIKVAINGFGRIGRAFFRQSFGNPDYDIVALNDLGDGANLAYLLEYDTVYGRSSFAVKAEPGKLLVEEKEVALLSERDPAKLPWRKLGIDVVIESTGVFDSYEKSQAHLDAGAKRVIISAPVSVKDQSATILIGANEDKLATSTIISNASCTTNAANPLIGILDEKLGIEKAILNTVHAYTATQSLVDAPGGKDLRRGRAAAQNIVPSSTGAAIATTKAYTKLEGKFDGIAIRVPVVAGSIVDVTFVASRDTTKEEVNNILTEAAQSERWGKIFTVTNEPIVSSDIIGARFGAIADLDLTRVVGGNLVKVMAWYDNEAGYAATLCEHVKALAGYLRN